VKLDKTPDWDVWQFIPAARLWDVVAISCDLDPEAVEKTTDTITSNSVPTSRVRHFEAYPGSLPRNEDFGYRRQLEFWKRLKVAEANLSEVGRLKPADQYRDINRMKKVFLIDFAVFAESLNWNLPEYFPRSKPITTNIHTKAGTDKEELSTKRRNSYLLLIAALLKHAGINHEGKGVAGPIKLILETNGTPMDEKTIRSILAEISDALGTRQQK
jgi:hypothetical protein